ncbi:hypothetical protein SAMN05216503_3020 [Polaribacter sp. KT25b]|uniref:Rieske (2Fe-2S) protein n=1 Tax=Polaribacter sp. KT25b TaxID=1855336 RepID=UPI00087D8A5A|nr:hypothetical protein [Polaribacter sp. KT25b]SDS42467.1 hypothetical protein SAMN05216503_3020 [Polaribacter sp. KT25b]
MKKLIIPFCFLLLSGCVDNTTIINNCFLNVYISGTINLNNPQFLNLQVPLGYASATIDGRDLLIIKSTSSYKAYDLECPEADCSDKMTFDGLKLICPCSKKEYNSLNGSPIDGEGCFALEYNVMQTNNSTLQITR